MRCGKVRQASVLTEAGIYKPSGGGEGEGRQCPVQSQSNCDGRGEVIVAGFPRSAAQRRTAQHSAARSELLQQPDPGVHVQRKAVLSYGSYRAVETCRNVQRRRMNASEELADNESRL